MKETIVAIFFFLLFSYFKIYRPEPLKNRLHHVVLHITYIHIYIYRFIWIWAFELNSKLNQRRRRKKCAIQQNFQGIRLLFGAANVSDGGVRTAHVWDLRPVVSEGDIFLYVEALSGYDNLISFNEFNVGQSIKFLCNQLRPARPFSLT